MSPDYNTICQQDNTTPSKTYYINRNTNERYESLIYSWCEL